MPRSVNGEPLRASLPAALDIGNTDLIRYDDVDDFLFFKTNIAKTRSYYRIRKHFDEISNENLYQKLTELPFHMVISISPDLSLKKAMDHASIPYEFEYYRKYQNPKEGEMPSSTRPLIYNLLGSIEDDESLVLTHNDLFDFLFSILGANSLPNHVRLSLKAAQNFIFLGFSFDKWYVKLLLRLLDVHHDKATFASLKTPLTERLQNFFVDHFEIEFLDISTEEFVEALHEKCKHENMLRDPNQMALSLGDQIRSFIDRDDVDLAIEKLKSYFEGNNSEDLLDDITLLSSRYNRLKRKIQHVVIPTSEAEIEMNRIKDALIQLSREVNG